MNTDLVPQTAGRPAVLQVQGGVVYLGIKDAYVLARERAFSQQLRQTHPDHGRTHHRLRVGSHRASRTRTILAARAAFRQAMAAEYAALGVPPLVPVVQPLSPVCPCGRTFTGRGAFCTSYCPARQRALQAQRPKARHFTCACGTASTTLKPDVTACLACRRPHAA